MVATGFFWLSWSCNGRLPCLYKAYGSTVPPREKPSMTPTFGTPTPHTVSSWIGYAVSAIMLGGMYVSSALGIMH